MIRSVDAQLREKVRKPTYTTERTASDGTRKLGRRFGSGLSSGPQGQKEPSKTETSINTHSRISFNSTFKVKVNVTTATNAAGNRNKTPTNNNNIKISCQSCF